MKQQNQCDIKQKDKSKGILAGIGIGLIPHIGCIAFFVLTILGITAGAAIFKPLLANKLVFPVMIIFSFLLAGISSFFYLRRNCCVNKTRYLGILFGSIILINLIMYFFVFPAPANIGTGKTIATDENF